MKALCIMQPWASMILSGHKTVEIRNWVPRQVKTPFRVGVVSSTSISGLRPYLEGLDPAAVKTYFNPDTLLRGYLLGTVLVSGIKEYRTFPEYEKDMKDHRVPAVYYRTGIKGWQLEDPILYAEPKPCKGFLGIFEVSNVMGEESPIKVMDPEPR